ncbi:peptide ABC transporter ATP-binding protein [Virgibacillus profundi]|uniref:Nickel import system ATP-binding protein NikD n=2 Tax=Virgibacillus profundi TaxID=2024555 RepID=A0A2A2IHC8_9BACI|nr:peptide ABC transporter ATP-binding protein [Virgibacillus profundi]PXY54826.1 ABC transporter ATP-binding protein [Virgibacillus profundi]
MDINQVEKSDHTLPNSLIKDKTPLFEVNHLSLTFRQYKKGLRESSTQVIRDFSLKIHQGEIVAVVGASGSGKSLLADAILGILPENADVKGDLKFAGEELTMEKQMLLRGKDISLIPQSTNALDPLMKAGKQVQSVIKRKNKKSIQERIFHKVGLSKKAGEMYPFELSGGMARRVLVSTAMVSEAKLVIADEPTPGLDEHARNETIHYIKQLADGGKSIMFITHDITAALEVADKVAVFYAGETVEIANIDDFTGKGENLRHPYTRALWNALPQNDFIPLKGSQPLPGETINGCAFESRCPIAVEYCAQKPPQNKSVSGGIVRCFHA